MLIEINALFAERKAREAYHAARARDARTRSQRELRPELELVVREAMGRNYRVNVIRDTANRVNQTSLIVEDRLCRLLTTRRQHQPHQRSSALYLRFIIQSWVHALGRDGVLFLYYAAQAREPSRLYVVPAEIVQLRLAESHKECTSLQMPLLRRSARSDALRLDAYENKWSIFDHAG